MEHFGVTFPLPMGIANPSLYIRNKVLRYVLGSLSFNNFSVEIKTEHNIMTCRVRDRNTNGLIFIVYILNTLSHPCCPHFIAACCAMKWRGKLLRNWREGLQTEARSP